MTSIVNEGNEVLVVLGNDVPSDDTTDFIATLKQCIGDSGKLRIASLSDVKKGECTFHLICIKKYRYIIYKNLFTYEKNANLLCT